MSWERKRERAKRGRRDETSSPRPGKKKKPFPSPPPPQKKNSSSYQCAPGQHHPRNRAVGAANGLVLPEVGNVPRRDDLKFRVRFSAEPRAAADVAPVAVLGVALLPVLFFVDCCCDILVFWRFGRRKSEKKKKRETPKNKKNSKKRVFELLEKKPAKSTLTCSVRGLSQRRCRSPIPRQRRQAAKNGQSLPRL